jgi:hypothetical protein
MEAKDYWLLLASIPISYLAGLLTTFTAPTIGRAYDKLKSGFIERNKATALSRYPVVRDLKSGKRDKYLYAISGWGSVLCFLMLFVVCSISAL